MGTENVRPPRLRCGLTLLVIKMIESLKEAFAVQVTDERLSSWAEGICEKYDTLMEKHNELVNNWNKFVPRYNLTLAPTEIGRPLEASPAQCTRVLQLREAGTTMRVIAEETNLGFQTVRTIIGRKARSDRASACRLHKIDPEKATTDAWKARKRTRDAFPKRINCDP